MIIIYVKGFEVATLVAISSDYCEKVSVIIIVVITIITTTVLLLLFLLYLHSHYYHHCFISLPFPN